MAGFCQFCSELDENAKIFTGRDVSGSLQAGQAPAANLSRAQLLTLACHAFNEQDLEEDQMASMLQHGTRRVGRNSSATLNKEQVWADELEKIEEEKASMTVEELQAVVRWRGAVGHMHGSGCFSPGVVELVGDDQHEMACRRCVWGGDDSSARVRRARQAG